MPEWAQMVGAVLPLTHYLRFVRGVLLKGATGLESLTNIWPILVFFCAVIAIGMLRYRKTLD
jgi:ABC-2 type transport system permease protein